MILYCDEHEIPLVDGRHCIFCGDKEGTNDNSRSSTN